MARSTLMRVSNDRAERVKELADTNGRQHVTELDRIIDAGIEKLYEPRKASRRRS